MARAKGLAGAAGARGGSAVARDVGWAAEHTPHGAGSSPAIQTLHLLANAETVAARGADRAGDGRHRAVAAAIPCAPRRTDTAARFALRRNKRDAACDVQR